LTVERFSLDGSKVEQLIRPNPHAPRIDSAGNVAGAAVYLRGVDPLRARPWDHPPVVVEYHDDGPIVRQGDGLHHIGFVRRGDVLTVVNKEPRYQSARARGAAFFTLTLPEHDQPRKRVLNELGWVELSSAAGDPHIRGHVLVSDHPYVAITDDHGHFSMPQVPAGDYELVCWMPNWQIDRLERDPETLMRVRVYYKQPMETHQTFCINAEQITIKTIEVIFP